MDAARAFMSDLEAIRADYVPRLKAAQAEVDELKRGVTESVAAACTLWASQSDRPSAIRQAAKVATLRLERGESCDLGMVSARAILATAAPSRAESDDEKEQRARREHIRDVANARRR